MSHDELIEIQISALLDGELTRSETVVVIDRLVEDPAARRFWAQVRGLERVLEQARSQTTRDDDFDRLWPDIVDAARRSTMAPWRRLVASPALRAAAAVVAVGLGLWLWRGDGRTGGPAGGPPVLQVVVGSAPDRMDDDRFVEVAVELLEAEPRYRQTMAQLLDQVHHQRDRGEGAAEGPRSLGRAELLLVDDDSDGPASSAGLRY